MKNQSQITISLVLDYCKSKGIEATEFKTVFKSVLSKDDEHNIENTMFAMFKEGLIPLSKGKDDRELKLYCKNLLSDRLKKSKTLNGNITYEPMTKKEKKREVNDEQLQALTALMSIETNEDNILVLEEAIQKRQHELKVQQQQALLEQIDLSLLDKELLKKLGR